MDNVKSQLGIVLLAAAALGLAVTGANAEYDSGSACMDACDVAEAACYANCEGADDAEICEIGCEEEANACYEACEK